MSIPELEWEDRLEEDYGNTNPVQGYIPLVDEFGTPTSIDTQRKGMAYWNRRTLRARGDLLLQRVEVYDEMVVHSTPTLHYDYVYAYIKLSIPSSRVCQVLAISPTITYDPLKQWLRIRCRYMGAIYAIMLLCAYVARGELTIEDIEQRALYTEYVLATDPESDSYDPDSVGQYRETLLELVDDDGTDDE